MHDFAALEAKFDDLLLAFSTGLAESEQREIRDFLDVGEYGLALQTAIDIALEGGRKVPTDVASICEDLAAAMGIESEVDLSALRALSE